MTVRQLKGKSGSIYESECGNYVDLSLHGVREIKTGRWRKASCHHDISNETEHYRIKTIEITDRKGNRVQITLFDDEHKTQRR